MAAPVTRNDEIELHVDSLAYGGNGVARLNGFVVFVKRGLPGDTVRATVTKVKRGFAEATATEVLVPSPDRTDAPCKHYYEGCGGGRFPDPPHQAPAAAKEGQGAGPPVRGGGMRGPPPPPLVPAGGRVPQPQKTQKPRTPTPRPAAPR